MRNIHYPRESSPLITDDDWDAPAGTGPANTILWDGYDEQEAEAVQRITGKLSTGCKTVEVCFTFDEDDLGEHQARTWARRFAIRCGREGWATRLSKATAAWTVEICSIQTARRSNKSRRTSLMVDAVLVALVTGITILSWFDAATSTVWLMAALIIGTIWMGVLVWMLAIDMTRCRKSPPWAIPDPVMIR